MSDLAKIFQSRYLKGKNFNPMPVARGGILKEADSRLNPKVRGTPAWESYWNDQLWLIHNGLQVGGIYIPGRYYYYLNFNDMATVNGIISPDMVDLHLELIYLIEHAFANQKDILVAKKRRAGISELTQKAVTDYGFRFQNGAYQCGIAAGQDIYAQDFMKKWRASEALLPPELQIKKLKNNDDEVIAGYKIKKDGTTIEGGTKNTFYVRTMKQNPALFKGLFLNTVIAEECGEFEHLSKFLAHTRPCVMDGSRKVGNFMVYGTGGNMNKGSKDFQDLWYETKKGNTEFIPMLITAERFHKPFYGGCKVGGEEVGVTPNLDKEFKKFELIGVEDTQAALDFILNERQEILKSKNSEKYQEHLKDYPLTEGDVFRKTIVNAFDTDAMNNQMDAILANPKKYLKCEIEWKRNEKGEALFPPQTELKFLPDNFPEDGVCFLIHADHLGGANKQYNKLFCAGLDGYDIDLSKTSKSKGAMCVIIRRNNIPGALQLAPVATICCRPDKKEVFYEMCVKLAVHFDLQNSVLPDVRSSGVITWFQNRGMEQYLAYRPKKWESENSEQNHTWGISLNNYSKPKMLGEMQSAIDYFCDQIWFPELLNQLQNFDIAYIGSDNDLGDAYGMALLQDGAEEIAPRDTKTWSDKEMYELGGEWKTDKNGDIIPVEPTPFKGEEHDHPNLWGEI